MMLFVAGFFGMLLVTFGLIALLTRPTTTEKAVEQRLSEIESSGAQTKFDREISRLLKVTKTGHFAWLDEQLLEFKFARTIQQRIIQADSTTSIASLLLLSLALAFLACAVCYLFIPVLAVQLVTAAGAAALPIGFLNYKRGQRLKKFNKELPNVIDIMSRALHAGHSLVGSIEIIAEQATEPAASEFAEVFKQQNFGLPLREALIQMMERVPSQDLRVFVTAILVQKDTGGDLVEILEKTVFVIRERMRIQGEIRVQTAQGRLTGWILTMLPVIMLVLLNLVNPGYSTILLEDPMGRKLIYVGLVLLVTGGFIIRQIINGIEV